MPELVITWEPKIFLARLRQGYPDPVERGTVLKTMLYHDYLIRADKGDGSQTRTDNRDVVQKVLDFERKATQTAGTGRSSRWDAQFWTETSVEIAGDLLSDAVKSSPKGGPV